MISLNEIYLSPALKKALLDGADALKDQACAVEAELKKHAEEGKCWPGQNVVVNTCMRSCESLLQSADLLEGFVKRHGPADETHNSRQAEAE